MKLLMISDVYFPRVNGVSTSIQTFRRELAALGHAQREGEAGRAARLFGAAASLRERIRYPVRGADQASHAECVGVVRAALGEESFASGWSEGRLLSPEHALDLAMA